MTLTALRRTIVSIALALAFALAATSNAHAGIWLGSLNCYRLGHNYPSGANQTTKKTMIRDFCATNNVTILQEVMVTSEVANVKPGGYFSMVSALKGSGSYFEAYGFVYNATVTGAINNYTSASVGSFSRPPSGVRYWTGAAYCWVVNYHAAFDAAPNATEIQLLDTVYNFFKNKNSVIDVVMGGDYNRTATSSYFNNLKATGCNQIAPNVNTTINTSCGYASPYDHFAWNPTYTSVSSAGIVSVNACDWRNMVSDHAPVRCYINN